MRHRRILIAAGAILAGALVSASVALWRASRVLRAAEQQTESARHIAFSDTILDRAVPAGWESISAPSGFRDAAILNGHAFVTGGAGVFEYDAEGRPLNRFRAGLELPAAPCVAAATGIAGGAPSPELWIATSGEGALAYDGSRFRHLRPTQSRYRKLTAVLPLSTGRILFGTEKAGIVSFDGREFAPFHESLSDLHVTTLAGDEANLWIGLQDAGVVHWRAGELERVGEKEGLPDPRVFAITVDGDTAWAATALGVAEIRAGKVQRVLAQGFTVQSVLKQGDELLIGTLNEGLFRVPLAARSGPLSATARERESQFENVQRILAADGAVLALTSDMLFRAGSCRGDWTPVFAHDEARLADRNIAAVAPDNQGRLWVGYFDRGLDVLGRDASRPEHIEDSIVFCINRIVHDRGRERVAVATANGLVIFSQTGARRQVLTRADGLIANHVTDVLVGPDGALVAGTPAGVSFIEGSKVSSVYAFHGLVNNHVYALGQLGNRTFVGTLGGLSVIESGLATVRFTTANSGFRHNWITAVLPAATDVFIGTYGGGIVHMGAGGAWEPFADLPPAFEVNPNAMAASDRAVYAGTLDRGLAVFDRNGGRWRWITRGFPSQNVTAVAAERGSVFIGTDNGLVRVSEEALLR
jgi:ligand-binding sensor domain-containing protein